MNDLIMRKDVEQMLKDLGGCDASDKEAAGWDKAIGAAMEGLRKVEIADRWIPCSERLPEVPEDTDDEDCPEFNVMIKGASIATTLKYSPDGAWFDDLGQVYEVIVWMPLPEPWEGEYKVKGRIVIEIEKIPKDCFSCVQVNEYGYCQWINKYIDCCSKIGERYPTCPIEPWEGE